MVMPTPVSGLFVNQVLILYGIPHVRDAQTVFRPIALPCANCSGKGRINMAEREAASMNKPYMHGARAPIFIMRNRE
jgi:hypothetical protein